MTYKNSIDDEFSPLHLVGAVDLLLRHSYDSVVLGSHGGRYIGVARVFLVVVINKNVSSMSK